MSCAASTEPRHFGRGESYRVEVVKAEAEASTEPRHFGRGEHRNGGQRPLDVRASTEPRHFGRGECPAADSEPNKLLLQRSPGTSAGERKEGHEIEVLGKRFNGAPALRPGRDHLRVSPERRQADRFNGAPALRPGRAEDPRAARWRGPRLQRSPGTSAGERDSRRRKCRSRRRGFNGAPALRPGRAQQGKFVGSDMRSFNGAPALRPGRGCCHESQPANARRLQRSPGTSAGERSVALLKAGE